MPVFGSTWGFSLPGVEEDVKQLQKTNKTLYEVKCGIQIVEEDPTVTPVRYSGITN